MSLFDFLTGKGRKSMVNKGKTFDAPAWGTPSFYDMEMVASGRQTTAIMKIQCGGCGKEWKDAVVPNEETNVKCPHCGGTNRVNSKIRFYSVDRSGKKPEEFIGDVKCPNCGKKWRQAIFPNQLTILKCPHCGGSEIVEIGRATMPKDRL
jgi:ribosomal protein S27E